MPVLIIPQQWRELLQRELPGLTAGDVEWLSIIKEEVRPKRKAKKRGTLVDDSGKRTRKREGQGSSQGPTAEAKTRGAGHSVD
jgi:hypothetical protein